ncbi:MAG: TIR domain-containing protein [Methanothrix sp.]|nr:TIR domain-containing protein [Methanothrix sp.]MDD4446895.1 TIR domain-containing protein [Methanothrix sp.]
MNIPLTFISYAHEDEVSAIRLYSDLKRAGANPWIDKECLLPGQKWEIAIKRAIKSSDFFLAVLSSKSVEKRGYVQKEITQALDILDEFPESRIFLIPIRLDKCEPSHEKLKCLHRADMFPIWENGLAKILKSINIKRSRENIDPSPPQSTIDIEDEVEKLIRDLESPYERVQYSAAIRLGELCDMRSIDPLCRALIDWDRAFRDMQEEPDFDNPEDYEADEIERSENWDYYYEHRRNAAISALEKISSPEALDILKRISVNPGKSPKIGLQYLEGV